MEILSELIFPSWGEKLVLWLAQNHIELIATLTGFIYLLYSIKGKKQLWMYGLITSGLYVYVCLDAKIYADMGINIYYVIVSVYGWIHWSNLKGSIKKEISITQTSIKEMFVFVSIAILIFIVLAFLLKNNTDSDIPYWDSFTTSASIIATWMLARKKIEHWLIWIIVDAISVSLYIHKGLYPTSILFLVYTILAGVGFYEWKRKCLTQKQNT